MNDIKWSIRISKTQGFSQQKLQPFLTAKCFLESCPQPVLEHMGFLYISCTFSLFLEIRMLSLRRQQSLSCTSRSVYDMTRACGLYVCWKCWLPGLWALALLGASAMTVSKSNPFSDGTFFFCQGQIGQMRCSQRNWTNELWINILRYLLSLKNVIITFRRWGPLRSLKKIIYHWHPEIE